MYGIKNADNGLRKCFMLKSWQIFLFFSRALSLWAGDIAVFSDLGFSEDGKFYAFAQYGVHEETLLPWAEFFIVNVSKNDFATNGKVSYLHTKRIEPGQDGSGALFRIISSNKELASNFGITFLRQGVPLFVSLENGQDPSGQDIEFRDFDKDATYKAILRTTIHGSGAGQKSSFYIDVERNNTYYKVGTPEILRSKVTSYTIKKVLVTPDRTEMIFVIEMTVQTDNGPDIRYMIEALRFK
jgi:predicted secreted protein